MEERMRVAIVGATGAVGHELLKVLEGSSLRFDELLLFASPRSAGSTLMFRNQPLTCLLYTSPSPRD